MIFVSYPSELAARAESLKELLRAARLTESFVCHLDRPDLAKEERPVQIIELSRELAKSSTVVLFWDRSYRNAPWCIWEARLAADATLEGTRRILVVRCDQTPIPTFLNAAEIVEGESEAVQRLCDPNVDSAVPMEDRSTSFIDWISRWAARNLIATPGFALLESVRLQPIAQVSDARGRGSGPLVRVLVCLAAVALLVIAGTTTVNPSASIGWAVGGFALLACLLASLVVSTLGAVAATFTTCVLGAIIATHGEGDGGRLRIMAACSGVFVSTILIWRLVLIAEPPASGRRARSVSRFVARHGRALLATCFACGLTAGALVALPSEAERIASANERAIAVFRQVAPGCTASDADLRGFRKRSIVEWEAACGGQLSAVTLVSAALRATEERTRALVPTRGETLWLGAVVGLLAGIALGLPVRAMVRRKRRDRELDTPLGFMHGTVACTIVALLTIALGIGIAYFIDEGMTQNAQAPLYSSLVGLQIALVVVAAAALPLASTRQSLLRYEELAWGLLSAVAVTVTIALLIDRLPFGMRDPGAARVLISHYLIGSAAAGVGSAVFLLVVNTFWRSHPARGLVLSFLTHVAVMVLLGVLPHRIEPTEGHSGGSGGDGGSRTRDTDASLIGVRFVEVSGDVPPPPGPPEPPLLEPEPSRRDLMETMSREEILRAWDGTPAEERERLVRGGEGERLSPGSRTRLYAGLHERNPERGRRVLRRRAEIRRNRVRRVLGPAFENAAAATEAVARMEGTAATVDSEDAVFVDEDGWTRVGEQRAAGHTSAEEAAAHAQALHDLIEEAGRPESAQPGRVAGLRRRARREARDASSSAGRAIDAARGAEEGVGGIRAEIEARRDARDAQRALAQEQWRAVRGGAPLLARYVPPRSALVDIQPGFRVSVRVAFNAGDPVTLIVRGCGLAITQTDRNDHVHTWRSRRGGCVLSLEVSLGRGRNGPEQAGSTVNLGFEDTGAHNDFDEPAITVTAHAYWTRNDRLSTED